MTGQHLWKAVGEALMLRRRRLGLQPSKVKHGPNYHTIEKIEAGEIGTVEKLDQYAEALGLTTPDVLRAVLSADETPLTPEVAALVRKFQRISVPARQALLAAALAYPDDEAALPPDRQ